MVKKTASIVLASLGSPGRLTISAARTNVVLLIRRTVRPSTYTIKRMGQLCARAAAHGEKHVSTWTSACLDRRGVGGCDNVRGGWV
ncbi:MAG: hypothetical protein A3A88_07540 [Nitrospirae bacterium RIFCSPLOWO2_01_FULL_62_17]|nr:MAG: hypothetical protein A3A88_07540 [Nitrospirae bacterium RIFCSPLOWO2_01_FULL_62_17]